MFAGRFSSSIGLLGVDFGSRGLKLVQVREHQRELDLVGAAHIDWSPLESDEGDPEGLARQIKSAVTHGGFAGRRCVVGLPRTDVSVQSIRLPRMPDAELKQAAIWEASQRFGYDRGAMEADYIRTGASPQSNENREEVLLIATPHSALDARLAPVMAAGLRPVAVEANLGPLARIYSRHCRRESDQTLVRVVVEIGSTGSTVMILQGDQIVFAKPVAISGDQLTAAVGEHLQLDERAAAELRASRILAAQSDSAEEKSGATDRAAFDAVRPLLGDLVKEVVLCLRYYGVTFRGHPPEQIVLSGGDAMEPSLDTMLNGACKIPVVHDDPMSTLQGIIMQIREKLNSEPGPAACWAVAAGLSVRGIEESRASKKEDPGQASRRGAA